MYEGRAFKTESKVFLVRTDQGREITHTYFFAAKKISELFFFRVNTCQFWKRPAV